MVWDCGLFPHSLFLLRYCQKVIRFEVIT